MRSILYATKRKYVLFLLAFALAAPLSGCRKHFVSLTIKADGSCDLAVETVVDRLNLEQGLGAMEAYRPPGDKSPTGKDSGSENQETGEDARNDDAKKEDRLLEERIRRLYEKESPDPEAVGAEILEKVLVEGDEVRLVERSSFASIEEFFAYEETFGPMGFSMLLEEKDADTLRLAFSMENETAWNFVEKQIEQFLKAGLTWGLTMETPGEVASGTFPHVE